MKYAIVLVILTSILLICALIGFLMLVEVINHMYEVKDDELDL